MKSSSACGRGSSVALKNRCPLCKQGVDKDEPTTYKEVKGWVGGPRKDSMRLREDTGRYAHEACVKKIASGQAIDQPTIQELIDRSSLGTPEAKAARASVSDEQAARVVARAKELSDLLDD